MIAVEVSYGEHELQNYDIYLWKEMRPTCIFIHGGGSIMGSKADGRSLASPFLKGRTHPQSPQLQCSPI